MIVRTLDNGDVVCEHGTSVDVHCCNCHSGFLFDAASCVCVPRDVRYIVRRRDGFYYQRGPAPHWTEDLDAATVFEFRTIAELEAMRHLGSYAYDVVAFEL